MPLRVTARLQGAVAMPNGPIMIDALLAWAVAQTRGLPPLSVVGTQNAERIQIPIARSACDRIWMCSEAQYTVDATEHRWVNRKFPISEAQMFGVDKFRRIKISAGAQKSYRLPLETVHVAGDTVTWFVDGDADEIRALLPIVSHLGKRRAVGAGKVQAWNVTPCETWPGFPVVRDGQPLRSLPLGWDGVEDSDRAYRVLEPPYWRHEAEEECLIPIRGAA